MKFLTPAAFFLAGLLPLIVLMYLLKLRRIERPVSSTYLWRNMVRDVEANAPWQRLRYNLLMVLQLLFLALLILALARPALPGEGIAAQAAIFIVDTSASMGASDVTPSRIEAAKAQARQLIAGLPEAAEVTVIEAGQKARVLAANSRDRRQALQAVESLRAGAGGSDMGVALQLAAAIARRQPDTQTVILSDGNASLPERVAIQGRVQYAPIGLQDANQAIGLLTLQPALKGGRLTAFAQIINYGPQPAQRRVAFYADGQMIDAFDVSLPPAGEQSVLAQGILSTTQVIEARLLPPENTPAAPPTDYLAADDQALAVNRPAGPLSVTLVSPGNLFLETGLSLLPGRQVTRVNPGASLPTADLTILDGGAVLSGALPGGALLFIGPLQSTAFFSVTGQLSAPQPRPAAEAGPLLQYVSLDGVNILDAARIPLPGWARPIIVAEADGAAGAAGERWPLLFAGEIDGRRVAVLAFDLRRSDLPLQVAFPLLLASLTGWLAPGQGAGLPAQVQPGAAVALAPAAEAAGRTTITVTRPDGGRVSLEAGSGPAVFADTAQPGLYVVDNGGLAPLRFAVNLFAPQESRLAPRQELPVQGLQAAGAGAQSEPAYREWWRLLAALALGALTAEWLVYHRAKVAKVISNFGFKL